MEQLYLSIPNIRYKEPYLNFVKECDEDVIKTGFEFCIPISKKESFDSDINKLINMSKN